MDKRFIIAITLIFVVIFIWPLLFRTKRPATTPKKDEVVQKQEPVAVKPPEIRPQVSPDTIVSVWTPLYELQLTTEGARAISWKLREYPKRTRGVKTGQGYIDLIPQDLPAGKAENWLAIKFTEALDSDINDEVEYAAWTVDKKSLNLESSGSEQDSIEFVYNTSSGIVISKKMIFFRDSYIVDIDISFYNSSPTKADLKGYNLCWGSGITKDEMLTDAELASSGPIALLKTEKGMQLVKHWHRTGFACFGGKYVKEPERDGPIYWVAFSGKYFVTVLIPGPDPWWGDAQMAGKRYAVMTDVNDPAASPRGIWKEWGLSTIVALVRPGFSVDAGKSVLHKYRVYTGPEKWDILRSIKGRDDPKESLGLGRMMNFGTFGILGKATLWILNLFYFMTRNYGVAIIFLTTLIKILYLPLTQKSYKSMNKMQGLQPKLAALREKYRDDPQRMQKETFKVYKQHGVSPWGGCIPLLLQMPVFWALFTTLRGAVELRGATFIPGWIYDLSLPDTVASISGFPIRILPILMTGTMLIQQLFFSSGTSGPGQSNKMMAFMPVIFLFIFYGMPSGLVLYWLFNNILTIGHQYLLGRKKNTDTEDQEKDENKKNRKNSKEKKI